MLFTGDWAAAAPCDWPGPVGESHPRAGRGALRRLTTYADSVVWTRASAAAWVAHVCLNALSVSINLHVAIGRRWPFGGGEVAGSGVPGGQEPR